MLRVTSRAQPTGRSPAAGGLTNQRAGTGLQGAAEPPRGGPGPGLWFAARASVTGPAEGHGGGEPKKPVSALTLPWQTPGQHLGCSRLWGLARGRGVLPWRQGAVAHGLCAGVTGGGACPGPGQTEKAAAGRHSGKPRPGPRVREPRQRRTPGRLPGGGGFTASEVRACGWSRILFFLDLTWTLQTPSVLKTFYCDFFRHHS